MSKRTNTAAWLDKYSRWQIKVQKDGIRRTFTSAKPGRTGQREANAKADAWLDEGISDTTIRAEALFADWLDQLKQEVSCGTWKQYEGCWTAWINPAIGKLKISDVTEAKLQAVLNKMNTQKLSKKYISNVRACMTAFLKYCRSRRCTTLHPENLHVPRTAQAGERKILQPEDLKILFTKETTKIGFPPREQREPNINAYRFEVATGLRPGEIRGLQWQDIQDGTVTIHRSINQYDQITPGKNKNARRQFQITKLAASILEDQAKFLEESGIESDWVFPREDGDFTHYDTYYDHWKRYAKNEGLTPCHTYELRHTFISMVKSLPEGYLRALVGHSADMDTYAVYSHEVTGDQKKTADLVQSIFDRYLSNP